MSFVLVFASCSYFATEVLACHREDSLWRSILAKKRCLRRRGEKEELPLFLSIGMSGPGFPLVCTKLVLSSRDCDH